jgi:hypothetical protein
MRRIRLTFVATCKIRIVNSPVHIHKHGRTHPRKKLLHFVCRDTHTPVDEFLFCPEINTGPRCVPHESHGTGSVTQSKGGGFGGEGGLGVI